MPRPVKQNETPGVFGSHDKKHPLGHNITISADYAVWDNTTGKFITPESLDRAK